MIRSTFLSVSTFVVRSSSSSYLVPFLAPCSPLVTKLVGKLIDSKSMARDPLYVVGVQAKSALVIFPLEGLSGSERHEACTMHRRGVTGTTGTWKRRNKQATSRLGWHVRVVPLTEDIFIGARHPRSRVTA